MAECPHHSQINFRVQTLEADMKEVQTSLRSINPKLWVAVLALVGSVVATFGSVLGVVLVAYMKSRGMM